MRVTSARRASCQVRFMVDPRGGAFGSFSPSTPWATVSERASPLRHERYRTGVDTRDGRPASSSLESPAGKLSPVRSRATLGS